MATESKVRVTAAQWIKPQSLYLCLTTHSIKQIQRLADELDEVSSYILIALP